MLPTQEEKGLAKEVMSKVISLYQKYCRTGTQLFPNKVLDCVK